MTAGPCWATRYNLGGELDFDDNPIRWRLSNKEVVFWEDKFLDDQTMGVIKLDPRNKAFWTTTLLLSKMEGRVFQGERELFFDGAFGYSERRWGSENPEKRIFVHGINFADQQGALVINAIQNKTYKISNWIYNIAIQHGGKFYQFRT
ncbi:MAG: hypothetical protein GY852_01690, partial [bacterium]|nr:hypothetical protein [bacterium]